MFADSVIVGVMFLVGIAITSFRGAAMALSGAIVGVITPVLLGADKNLIEMGLYAFNPVLTMMAIGWVFLKPSKKSAVLAFLAGMLTVVCQAGLANFLTPIGLPTLTFPFVLVMWMFCLLPVNLNIGEAIKHSLPIEDLQNCGSSITGFSPSQSWASI